MTESLAANGEELATFHGAANDEALAPPSAEVAADPGAMPELNLTQKMARRIKEERQKAAEQALVELFGSVEAAEAYRRGLTENAAAAAEAAAGEAEPAGAAEAQLQAWQQELALALAPVSGEYYRRWQGEVAELAARAHTDNATAFTLLLRERLPVIVAEVRADAEQGALARLRRSAASPGSLASAAAVEDSWQTLSDAQFSALVARVRRGEVNKQT